MMRAVIAVPFGRPERLARLLRLWRRQTVRVPLLLVGRSPGDWAVIAKRGGAETISGPATVGAARNAGLGYARAIGAEWLIGWDDDDYYGPRYVETVLDAAKPGVDAVSAGIAFVRFDDGLWLFDRPLTICPGHATSMRVETAPRFPEVSLGEDVAWSRELGLDRVVKLTPWHMVYDRRGDSHAFNACQDEFLASFGPARFIGEEPNSFVDNPSDVSCFPLHSADDERIFRALERHALVPHAP